jgi:hypothetical protein
LVGGRGKLRVKRGSGRIFRLKRAKICDGRDMWMVVGRDMQLKADTVPERRGRYIKVTVKRQA